MTTDEALALHPGAVVCHRNELDTNAEGKPVMRALRVTSVWFNRRRTVVLVRVASIAKVTWLDATSFELPPPKKKYNRFRREWLTVEETKERCVPGVVPPTIPDPDLFTVAALDG